MAHKLGDFTRLLENRNILWKLQPQENLGSYRNLGPQEILYRNLGVLVPHFRRKRSEDLNTHQVCSRFILSLIFFGKMSHFICQNVIQPLIFLKTSESPEDANRLQANVYNLVLWVLHTKLQVLPTLFEIRDRLVRVWKYHPQIHPPMYRGIT